MSSHRTDPRVAHPQPDNRAPDLAQAYSTYVVDHAVKAAIAYLFTGRGAGAARLTRPSEPASSGQLPLLASVFTVTGLAAILAAENHGPLRWLALLVLTAGTGATLAMWFVSAAADRVVPPPVRESTRGAHLPGRTEGGHPLTGVRASGLVEYVAGQVWVAQQPLRFYGMEMGTRMVVARGNAAGDLVVYSPIALTDALKDQVARLGKVRWIVAPNLLHHMYVQQWLDACPGAVAFAGPKLAERRKDIAWAGTITPAWTAPWDRALVDFVVFTGHPIMQEVVLYIPGGKTLVVADVVQNHAPHGWTGRVVDLAGCRCRPGPPVDWKLAVEEPAVVAAAAAQVEAWDFERIVIAHGDPIEVDAKDVWHDAFAFAG